MIYRARIKVNLALKLLAGAVAGGAVGFLLGRARVCSSEQYAVKANLIFSTLAGALFGAAVAWYFIHST